MTKYISLIIIVLSILSCGGETQKRDAGAVYKEGEILVKFRQNIGDMKKNAAHHMLGAQMMKKVKVEGVEKIKLPDNLSVEDAVRLYRENPDVEYAEPNYLVRAAVIPNDTRFTEQWYLRNTGQVVNSTAGTFGADIDAPEAWGITEGTSSVIIAVVDSGADNNHPDLRNNLLAGYDFVDSDSEPDDLNGHGTHVAGIIGAVSNNAQGVAGTAWNCRILPLKALDQNGEGTIDNIVDAIAFAADHNAKIINMSFAGSNYPQTLYNAIKSYPDMIFIAAAGNDSLAGIGGNDDVTPNYPASFDLPNIISVAATDQNDSLANFSNYGVKSVDIAAPGENIFSTIPSFITGITFSGSYKVIYLAFGFEGINGASARNEVMQRSLDIAGISGGDSILLVDDDGGKSYETYYAESLRALGYSFDSYQVPYNGDGPTADKLKQYALVIWFTGNEYRNTLTLTDQSNLQLYLNNGGALFMSGQDIGFDIGSSIFYQNYLHAHYVTDDANSSVFNGIVVELPWSFGDSAKNQLSVDVITPVGSAVAFSIDYHDAYQFFSGTSMSTAVVSGAAALVASYYGNFSAQDLKSVILHSVDIKQSLQGKTLTGGRLNAYKAVTAMLPPSELFGTPQAGGKVLLTWTDNSTAEQGFIIERKKSDDQFREVASVSSDTATYTDRGLEAGTFTYRVRGFIDQTHSLYSNEISVTVQDGAKSSGGGGGGCSLGNVTNNETAAADTFMLFLPVLIIWMVRRQRVQGGKDSRSQGFK
jgi:subtilisin family serine protease